MNWLRRHRRKLIYALSGCFLLMVLSIWGGYRHFKNRFYTEIPNTLTVSGELHSVPFIWVKETFHEDYVEPHSAILIPVKIPGIDQELHMQFDTGSPYTFFRSGCIESLKERGVECETFVENKRSYVRNFELRINGNKVLLNPARMMQRDLQIDWDNTYNNIGTVGADFLDNLVSVIDFPAEQILLSRKRPERLNQLGTFHPFEFRARRIMLPANIGGTDMQFFWDSGCSSFGLLTSKYHCEALAREDDRGITFQANRFGSLVPIHHKPCDQVAIFGDTEVPLQRVSYVEMYAGLQNAFGRFIDGGFLGNKSLTESTLILDTTVNEFLIIDGSLPGGGPITPSPNAQ